MSTESKKFQETVDNADFQAAVRMSVKSYATTVLGESTSTGTKKDKRHNLAHDALTEDYDIATENAWYEAVAADGDTNEYSSQSDVDTRVQAIWNEMAGVNAEDTGGV